MFVDPVVEVELTLVTPVTLRTACSIGSETSSATIWGDEPGYVAVTTAWGACVDGISSCFSVVSETTPKITTAIDSRATTSLFTRLSRVRLDTGRGSIHSSGQARPGTSRALDHRPSYSASGARPSGTTRSQPPDRTLRKRHVRGVASPTGGSYASSPGPRRVLARPAPRPRRCGDRPVAVLECRGAGGGRRRDGARRQPRGRVGVLGRLRSADAVLGLVPLPRAPGGPGSAAADGR